MDSSPLVKASGKTNCAIQSPDGLKIQCLVGPCSVTCLVSVTSLCLTRLPAGDIRTLVDVWSSPNKNLVL